MIEAVLFDGDQTLWDFQRVMRDALVAVVAELRAARPGPFTAALRWQELQDDRAVVAAEHREVWSLKRLRVLGFARTLERRREAEGIVAADGDAALAEQLGHSYFEHRDRDPALFDDTLPCMNALQGRYRLGLLSNGSRLPEKVGLGGYFESVVFAQDHRVAKPDRGIFEVVQRELGVEPERCVLVGDHPLNDVAGAKRAGWSAVWIDRDGSDGFPANHLDGEHPDAIVRSLRELPDTLERLAQGPGSGS
jgi:FMN hydrolase / 5-amino-6-(5-phospho-D-ribitylamino)uracil phosphatase